MDVLPELISVEQGEVASGPSSPGPLILQLWPFCELWFTGSFVGKLSRTKKKESYAQHDIHAIGVEVFVFSCSSSPLPFPGPSSSRVTHQNTNTLTLWPQNSWCVTSARQAQPWKLTARLMLPQSARPAPRSTLQRIGTGEIRASSAPQYVWTQLFSYAGFLLYTDKHRNLQNSFPATVFPWAEHLYFFFCSKVFPIIKKYMVIYMLSYMCCTCNRCVTAFRVCVSRCVKRGNLSSSSVTERMISSASARQATT